MLNANNRLADEYQELLGGWQIINESLDQFRNLTYSAIVENLEYLSDIKLREGKEQKSLTKQSLDALKASALKNQNKVPKKILAKTSAYIRDPYVVQYVKKQARGICDLCKKPAPFNNSDGEPYLECHHIVWLANEGVDDISNAVALCANCHRKMHILNSNEDVSQLKKKIELRDG